jgi:hypothetical protein
MARKRRSKTGDLAQLRAVLWQTILEVESLLDTRPPSNDLVLRSAHALAQLAGSYTRLVETADLSKRLEALELAMQERRER